MYCKKCHTLLDEDNLVCNKCKFDNANNIIKTNKNILLEEEQTSIKKKNYFIPILIFVALISCTGILLYSIKDTKSDLNTIPTTTKLVIDNEPKNKFTFNKINILYTDSFGSSASTIFYIANAAINITFKNIDSVEYQQLLEANECLDSRLGEINTKTYATDNSYSYLFMLNDEYYDITVNYNNSYDMTEQITNEINKVLNTISAKKNSK